MSLDYVNNIPVIIDRLRTANSPSNKIRTEFLKDEADFFTKHIKNKKVLVAGSGLGDDSIKIARSNNTVIGVDILPQLVTISANRIKAENISNVQFVQADFTTPRFIEDHFDVAVLNMGTIGNFDDKLKVIESLLNVATIVYFDIYKASPKALDKRKRMHEDEGWSGVKVVGKSIVSDDGLESEAIAEDELKEICNKLDAKVTFYDFSDIALMAEIRK